MARKARPGDLGQSMPSTANGDGHLPRCDHPNDPASTICTQCGGSLRTAAAGDAPAPPAVSLRKTLLWVLLGVLMAVLLFLILAYAEGVNRLGR